MMKKIIIALLLFAPFVAISQQVVNTANSNVKFRDTTGFGGGGGSGSLEKAFIDMSKPPYSLTTGANGSAAVQLAVDSLWNTYKGGTVYIPMNLNWPRPNAGSQKGVLLRPNIHIVGIGNRLSMTGNCAWFSTDFGTDSLGTTITANVDSSTTNYTVASSTGFNPGDTVYIRLGTAPYDAGEPTYYGYRKIRSIPDGTHITLDGPSGGTMVVASTSTLNRRIIRIHNLVTNASIENLELYNDGNLASGHVAEAGIYVQGGWNITLSNIRATNPGLGLACFQFCNGCVLKDSYLDSSANLSNANFGRGVTVNECEGCAFINNTFKSYQRSAFINESSNLYSYGVGNVFNNSFSDSPRVAITTLGSGTFKMDNTYFLGFQHILYDYVLSTGNVVFTNTQVQTGTKGSMYEQQGISIQPPLQLSSGIYYKRKTFSYKFNLPVNGSYSFDSLPKGLMLNINVEVDDTTGITTMYLRRDNSFTNNQVDMKSSLRPGIGVYPSGMGATFAVGNNLASSTLNYNEDKGFLITTNSTMPIGKTGTISFDYLELNNSPNLNRYNFTPFYDNTTPYPVVVQSLSATGQTAAYTGATYTTPNDGIAHTYMFTSYANITAYTSGTVTPHIAYTDDATNTSQSFDFYNAGATTAGLTGSTVFSHFVTQGEIRAKPNTTIIFSTGFSGAMTYNVSATITKIR